MGCDIHLHQEVKINGGWHHYRERNVPRSYKLFALMANVRNNGDIEPVSEAKGLPENITFLTSFRYEQYKSDWHHASWLDPIEIREVITRFFEEDVWQAEDWFGYLFSNSWRGFIDYRSDMPDELEDVRWVFWFDN